MIRRFAAMMACFTVVAVTAALPAAAHVVVSADNPEPGSFSVISIRVPNEESNADTVELKVQLPVEHPLAYVSVQPKPGWTFTTTKKKLATPIKTDDGTIDEAVSEITWTGGKIAPGEFDEFNIQAGPLPTGVSSLTFKAIQTYRDASGKTSDVAWIQTQQPGQPEPDHPAPTLQLLAGSAPTTTISVAATATPKAVSKSSTASKGLGVTALAVGGGGLIIGVIALVVAAGNRQRRDTD